MSNLRPIGRRHMLAGISLLPFVPKSALARRSLPELGVAWQEARARHDAWDEWALECDANGRDQEYELWNSRAWAAWEYSLTLERAMADRTAGSMDGLLSLARVLASRRALGWLDNDIPILRALVRGLENGPSFGLAMADGPPEPSAARWSEAVGAYRAADRALEAIDEAHADSWPRVLSRDPAIVAAWERFDRATGRTAALEHLWACGEAVGEAEDAVVETPPENWSQFLAQLRALLKWLEISGSPVHLSQLALSGLTRLHPGTRCPSRRT